MRRWKVVPNPLVAIGTAVGVIVLSLESNIATNHLPGFLQHGWGLWPIFILSVLAAITSSILIREDSLARKARVRKRLMRRTRLVLKSIEPPREKWHVLND